MKFLKELAERTASEQSRLTDTQKVVLVSIYAAPTPETAYEVTTGADNVSQAARQLRSLGLIVVDDINARAGVTDAGQEALGNVNMIDDTGSLTEEGEAGVQRLNDVRVEFEKATESVAFSILKSIS